MTEDTKNEPPETQNAELMRRREALQKLATIAAVTPPAVMALLYSRRAMAASAE